MTLAKPLQRIATHGPNSAKLEPWPEMKPADLASGTPVQTGCFYDEVEAVDYSVGIWECTAFEDAPGAYPVDEFMLLLEGTVEMAMPDGGAVTVNAGEAFVIPKGLKCQWKMPGTVRKIFMILDGAAPKQEDGRGQNAALGRVTVPPLGASLGQAGGLITRETHFVNHDGRMAVHVETYHQRLAVRRSEIHRRIVHVLTGEVRAGGEVFVVNDSLYLMPGAELDWDVAEGTRLLIAACDLAT